MLRTSILTAAAAVTLLGAHRTLHAQTRFAPADRGTAPTMLDLHFASRIALGDVDADGDLDIVIATLEDRTSLPVRRHRLLRNDGAGIFTDVTAAQMPLMTVCLAQDVALSDVDLDGDLDLLVAQAAITDPLRDALALDPVCLQNRLLLNDGAGNFTEAQGRISNAQYVTAAFAVADFDGDGDPDMLTCNRPYGNRGGSWSGQNRYFENDGTGTFIERANHLPADNNVERCAEVGDIDGDGDLDVVFSTGTLGSSGGNGVAAYRNDGTGRFALVAMPWPQSREAQRLALLDAEGDGDLDVAVMVLDLFGSPRVRTLALLLNDGTGAFQDGTVAAFGDPSQPLPYTSSLETSGDVEALDIDGDGDLDLALAANPISRLFRNDGGVFVELPDEALPANWVHDALRGSCSQHPESGSIVLAAGDLDGNGLADLVGVHEFDARIHLSTGHGTFEPLGEPRWNDDHRGDPAVGDIDGDGVPDVIATQVEAQWDGRTRPLRVLLGDGYGEFRDVSATHAPVFLSLDHLHAGVFGATPVLADVDGDGDLDLLASMVEYVNNVDVHEIRIWSNDGAGRFTGTSTTMPASVASPAVSDIECADLDGDGDLDCVVVQRTPTLSRVFVCTNDGAGNFTDTSGGLPPVTELHLSVSIGDLDGDHRPDLVLGATPRSTSSGWVGGQTRVWMNAGGMRFLDSPNLPFDADHTWSTALADVDGDGDLDILLANGGEFEPCLGPPYGAPAQQNRLWRNDGSAGFVDATAGVLPSIQDRTWQIVAMDVDEDGAPDLFARNGCPYRFTTDDRLMPEPLCPPESDHLLLRRGARYVDATSSDLAGPPAYTMASVPFDFDGDGDVDLLLESAAPIDRLHVLANRTSQLEIPERLRTGRTGRIVGVRLPASPAPSPFVLVVALAASGGDLPVPAFGGHYRLAAPTSIVLGAALVPPAGGEATVPLPVPAIPSLIGASIFVQGLFVQPNAARLTNALHETIGL